MTVTTRPPRVAPPIDAPIVPIVAPMPGETGIGRAAASPLRTEGPAKLSGTAQYTDDLVFPGAWYGHTIRSTEAHARLLGIEFDPAFDWSRVVVLTAKDIPGDNLVSLIRDDQPVLVEDEIRHHAEPVALIAAPDRETLREAKRRISLRTEPLPVVYDPLASTQEFAHFALAKGDIEAGFAAAEVVVEGTYRVGHQEQLYIENNAMIAVPRPDGGVTIHGSMQCPYYIHKALKRALRLSSEQAVVIQAETGGGFGGKEEYPSVIAIHAALLALRVGRPVRMIYDRHEDIAATTKRHPAIVTYRTGVTRDGTLVAQDIEVVMDGGAYCTLTAGRAVARHAPRRRPVQLAQRAHPRPGGGHQHAAQRRVSRLRRAADRVRRRDAGQPRGRRTGHVARSSCAGAGCTASATRRPVGQMLRESVAGEEVLERAAEAAEFERIRAQTAARATQQVEHQRPGVGWPCRRPSGAARAASASRSAWHGAGFTGRARSSWPASPASS